MSGAQLNPVITSIDRWFGGVDTATTCGETIAPFGLVLIVFGTVQIGRTLAVPFAVGAYIGAAYWFTSSTSFANPAVAIARMFTNSFAGIAPSRCHRLSPSSWWAGPSAR